MDSASETMINKAKELESVDLDDDKDVLFYKGHMVLT